MIMITKNKIMHQFRIVILMLITLLILNSFHQINKQILMIFQDLIIWIIRKFLQIRVKINKTFLILINLNNSRKQIRILIILILVTLKIIWMINLLLGKKKNLLSEKARKMTLILIRTMTIKGIMYKVKI